MRYLSLILILLATLLAGLLPVQAQTIPSFESADCEFETSFSREVTCGYLTVPENRGDPDSGTLRLHVAIFKAASDNPEPDPIVYLEGGPGGNALDQMEQLFDLFFAHFAEDRDFIVFDQRGTGYSEPALECPEANQLMFDTLDDFLSIQEEVDLTLGAIAACHKRLNAEGIHFDAYNSAENAADLRDLRLALGIQEWNLYGISYGTRLALTAMRDHPEGIRSVILDSSYPLEVDLFATAAQNYDRALQTLFDSCAADAACNANYPDLETVLFQTVSDLNANPVTQSFIRPSTGESYEVLIDGNLIMDFMFQALYQTGWLPSLPQIIYAASEGDFGLLGILYMAIADASDIMSYGMNLSVQCSEEVPFNTPLTGQSERASLLQEFLNRQINVGENMARACAIWLPDATPDPIENQPVYSDIPTLILSGQFDPITPPEWGEVVASTLSNSSYFEFPATGHGASVDGECASSITLTFLDDPTNPPDASCLAEMTGVAFIVPAELTLVPFEEPLFGISGVVPEGWAELAPGAYGRSEIGDVAISQLALAGFGLDDSLNLILAQFEMDNDLEPIETHTVGDLEWQIYRFNLQGLEIYLAGAEEDGTTYMILVQAPPGEIDILYDSLLIPAIEAFKPL